MEKIPDGYFRVSQILKPFKDFSHIDPYVLENKKRIGTNVHDKICAEINGIFLDIKEDELGYFESWEKWWHFQEIDSAHVITEKRFTCHDMKITGKLDCILTDPNGSIIVDFKTSATSDRKMWALQGCFYHYLARINGIELEPIVWFLQLKKDGEVGKLHQFTITEELWKKCLAAYEIFVYLNVNVDISS